VQIKHASFSGTIGYSRAAESEQALGQLENLDAKLGVTYPVCYYVMTFAEHGELFRLVETSERLSDNLIRYLFAQLVQGLSQLHLHGFVHRDIKPENLLIDKHLRLIIADFNFAQRL